MNVKVGGLLSSCVLGVISLFPMLATTVGGHSDAENEVRNLEADWASAVGKNDADNISQFFTPNFLFVGADGILQDRAQHLEDFRSGTLHLESCAIEDSTIHVIGDTAVVSATVGIIGQYQQRDISGYYQVTDTLVRQKDDWRVLSRQQTRIASRTDPLFERVGKPNGKPRVVLFVLGSFCPECMAQLLAFAKDAERMKYQVTVVSADSEADLKRFPDVPFKLVADPQHKLFRRFGAFQDKPLHGTFALDGRGSLVFSTTGHAPFMEVGVIQLWLSNTAK